MRIGTGTGTPTSISTVTTTSRGRSYMSHPRHSHHCISLLVRIPSAEALPRSTMNDVFESGQISSLPPKLTYRVNHPYLRSPPETDRLPPWASTLTPLASTGLFSSANLFRDASASKSGGMYQGFQECASTDGGRRDKNKRVVSPKGSVP